MLADTTVYQEMLRALPGRVSAGEPMKEHTSWRIVTG